MSRKQHELGGNGHPRSNWLPGERGASWSPRLQRVARALLLKRMYVLLALHIVIIALAYGLAFQLRFDLAVPTQMRRIFWQSLPWLLVVKLLVFHHFGSLRGWWRYITFADLAELLRVSTLSTLAITAVDYFCFPEYQIPRSVVLLDWGMTILLFGGLRSACRLVREHVWPNISNGDHEPALVVVGAEDGEGIARHIHNHPRLRYRLVGFLSTNASLNGSRLGGIPFLGGPEHAVALAAFHHVRHILVMGGSVSGRSLRNLVASCRGSNIELKVIPDFEKLMNAPYDVQVRDVNIEDLLRREPVELDMDAIDGILVGRRVMVTGAGGSIGSEICRQVMRCNPSRLVLVERAENSLFGIEQELLETYPDVGFEPCVADVSDKSRMRSLLERYRPEIIFHAAAHKHVPLMEKNPGQAVANNVIGTKVLADLADEYSVERFVMISTDKAVRPTSVMGVTKQIAESYVHALSSASDTKFVVVRFGNVLASAGSVVPIFQEQIRRGGPVTVTHPDMRRFFMTIPEASKLVLQASAMGRGGEIFVLDMGNPLEIMRLAEDMIRLSGLAKDDIEIKIIGPRPGEKLFEELYFDEETSLKTPHPKIRAAHHRPVSLDDMNRAIAALTQVIHGPKELIHTTLQEIVPEYQSAALRREHAESRGEPAPRAMIS